MKFLRLMRSSFPIVMPGCGGVSELIECSYTEDTSVLATEIKRVVQKLANADRRFMQPSD